MRKIILILLFLMLSINTCIAADESIEDIDKYFVDEQEQAQELHGYLEYQNSQTPETEDDSNSVLLDKTEVTGVNISQPKSFKSTSVLSNYNRPNLKPVKDNYTNVSNYATREYNSSPVSTTFSQKVGHFRFGTTYDSSLSSSQMNYSTSIFSKYEGKHFNFSTAFAKNTDSGYESYSDKFYIAPELKLTKRLSLLDVMQTDATQINKRNDIVLRYSPRIKNHYDDVQLELKAGQSYYDNSYINSSVQFSTRFKL